MLTPDIWAQVNQEMARMRANDTRPAAFLGDRTPRRVRWLRTVEWGRPCKYEATCAPCPDCGCNFINSVARFKTWKPDHLSPSRRARWSPTERKRTKQRCSVCQVELDKANKSAADKRYRAAKAEPKPAVICAHCGEAFTPQRSTARYCSVKCRVAAHRSKPEFDW